MKPMTGLIAAVLLCAAAVSAEAQESQAAGRLRAAGVEPTLAGVRGYLESLLDPESDRQVDRWITELGDAQFAVRERASLRLASLDFVAASAKLQAAASSPDPERAWRAKVALKGTTAEAGLLPAALRLIEEQKLAVGLPLLMQIRSRIASPAMQEAAIRAMLATVTEADRPALLELQKQDDAAQRGTAGRLLARLDRPPAKHFEGTFDAVKLMPGQVSGGGAKLIEGWEFRPRTDIVVTHLGLFDNGGDGLAAQHELAIWDVE